MSSGQRGAADAAAVAGAAGAAAGPAAVGQRPGVGEFAGRWRTSSHSGGGNECVALATTSAGDGGGWVAVRDTKHVGGGPVIVVPLGAVAALVDWLR